MKGFKDFIMQGNVIDLAVGVVIGSAFTALITAIVENLIQPVINVAGGTNVSGLSFTLIDGNEGSNVARWINHSCAPNCEAVVQEDERDRRHKDKIFIEAIRDIAAGEELTYNYGIRLAERHTPKLKKLWACRCGAPDCTGTILQPKR